MGLKLTSCLGTLQANPSTRRWNHRSNRSFYGYILALSQCFIEACFCFSLRRLVLNAGVFIEPLFTTAQVRPFNSYTKFSVCQAILFHPHRKNRTLDRSYPSLLSLSQVYAYPITVENGFVAPCCYNRHCLAKQCCQFVAV